MPTKRQKILSYIHDRENATVDELSRVFQVTPANIRHHLSILCEQGSVKVTGQKKTSGKGRPTLVYSASQHTDSGNLAHLADALLVRIFDNSSESRNSEFLSDIADLIASEYQTNLSNPTARLYSAIHSLNSMNYQAHWEAHIENPRIMLAHCPYRAIIERHPELCKMDEQLLVNLVGLPVRQTLKLGENAKGVQECVFLIAPPR